MVHTNHTQTCPICQQARRKNEFMHGDLIRPGVIELIQKTHPDWKPQDTICLPCLNRFLGEHVQQLLEADKGELSRLEKDVVDSLKNQDLISENVNEEFDQIQTLGERVADGVAEFGGSWTFIISFGVIIGLWITINTVGLLRHPFDVYPYILLNLVLSCLAAIQAPIIMMSQNRQESKDRLRAEHDYRINLKAELEIRQLNLKIDQLLTHQWQRLLEIQQVQTELMTEVAELTGRKR
jgi:uncharacterized membrane protein